MIRKAQNFRELRRNESGFTLVELMVVVIIIGILAMLAIPQFSGVLNNAEVKADIATGKTIKDAMDRYYIDNRTYPPGTGTSAADVVNALVSQNYIDAAAKYAQNRGGSAVDDPDNFNEIFVTTSGGDVQVNKVDGNFNNPVPEWSSSS